MNKRLVAYSVIPFALIAGLLISANTTKELDVCQYILDENDQVYVSAELDVNTEDSEEYDLAKISSFTDLGKSFVGFKEALGFKESRGNYKSVNTLGYMGKYQFGKETLKLIGIYNTNDFLNDPELQEKAFIANTMRNKWVLRRDIKRFVGQRIDGVLVTESGILAAAHLAGPGSVKKYLRSYGAIGFTDAYGTTVRNYMKKFSGYDTSFIQAEKKAHVNRL